MSCSTAGSWVEGGFTLPAVPPAHSLSQHLQQAGLPLLHHQFPEKLQQTHGQGLAGGRQQLGDQQPAHPAPLPTVEECREGHGGLDPWQLQLAPADGRSSEACSTQDRAAAALNADSPDSISCASLSPASLLPPQPRLEAPAKRQISPQVHPAREESRQPYQGEARLLVQPAQVTGAGQALDVQHLGPSEAVLGHQQSQRSQHPQGPSQGSCRPDEQESGAAPTASSPTAPATLAPSPAVQPPFTSKAPVVAREPQPQPRSRSTSPAPVPPDAAAARPAALPAPRSQAVPAGIVDKPPTGRHHTTPPSAYPLLDSCAGPVYESAVELRLNCICFPGSRGPRKLFVKFIASALWLLGSPGRVASEGGTVYRCSCPESCGSRPASLPEGPDKAQQPLALPLAGRGRATIPRPPSPRCCHSCAGKAQEHGGRRSPSLRQCTQTAGCGRRSGRLSRVHKAAAEDGRRRGRWALQVGFPGGRPGGLRSFC